MDVVKKYLFIFCGGAIQGIAMALFLFPHSIPSGGAGGIAILLHHFMHLPLGFALWLVNFSMLVLAIKWLGNQSAIGTMFGISVNSLFIYLFSLPENVTLNHVAVDLLLGAIVLGIGVGILLKQGVSNGGLGVLALIIAKYRDTYPGKPLFWMNGLIFVITAAIIAWHIVVLAIICQWISTKIVDYIYKLSINTKDLTYIQFRKK